MSYYPPQNNDIDIGSIKSQLKSFTNEELEAILNDSNNEQIDSFIKDLPQVKTLEHQRLNLIEKNKKMAEHNLSFESTYRIQREELSKALEECQTLKSELDKKKAKIREFGRQHSLDTTLALMQAAMAEAEEASDEVARSFIRKEIPIDGFLENFNEKRKLFHERRIKVEKMPAEINKIQSQPREQWRPYGQPQPHNLPFSSLSMNDNPNSSNNPNPPYPTNPFGGYFPYPNYN